MIYRNDDPAAVTAMFRHHYGDIGVNDDYLDADDDYWSERETEYMEERYEQI